MDQRIQKRLRDEIAESFVRQVKRQDEDPATVPIEAIVIVVPKATLDHYDRLIKSGIYGLGTIEEAVACGIYSHLRDVDWLLKRIDETHPEEEE